MGGGEGGEGEGGGGGWRGWEAGGRLSESVTSGEGSSCLRERLPSLRRHAPLLAPVLMDTLPSPWPSFSHMPLGGGTPQDLPITTTAPDMRISTTRLPKAPPLLGQSGVSSGSSGSPLRGLLPTTPTGLSTPSIPPSPHPPLYSPLPDLLAIHFTPCSLASACMKPLRDERLYSLLLFVVKVCTRSEPHAACPMPHAPCHMPHASCLIHIPHAHAHTLAFLRGVCGDAWRARHFCMLHKLYVLHACAQVSGCACGSIRQIGCASVSIRQHTSACMRASLVSPVALCFVEAQ